MTSKRLRALGASLTIAAYAAISHVPARADKAGPITHVLLVSIDGMHASDLSNYVKSHPSSTLAKLAKQGVTYANAFTTAPSDSFPGLLALVTGGTPKSTGVFYDDTFDRTLYAPGSNCSGLPGTEAQFAENVDIDSSKTNAGGTLGQPLTQIDATKLPMAMVNGKCAPVYPHQYLKVNTIFEVIHAAGRRTAWADKHPAYDLVNGPSGKGVDDLFTPEVNSADTVYPAITDTTKGFHSIQRNDRVKVQAVLNEISSLDSTGKTNSGVPAIFGMNFQAVSVGQKLAKGSTADPQDAGLIGGYHDATGATPNNGLAANLDYVDQQLGRMVDLLNTQKLAQQTLIVITSKHGQSPINAALRQAVDDSPYAKTPGFAQSTTDDVGLVWLTPGAQKSSYAAAKSYLLSQAATLGIVQLLDRDVLARLYRDPFNDNRTPDFMAVTKKGLIYTSGSKLAEHGGFADDDRHVALLVSNPAIFGRTVDFPVGTQQVAPTILAALGLDARQLQAVRIEGTRLLPGLLLAEEHDNEVWDHH